MVLTSGQVLTISIAERLASCISLLACFFIIGTFLCSAHFRSPINRLVFYASFGNVLACVGTLISTSAVGQPDGPLCQFQGFMIQMFMPADAMWNFVMALNVYLTFFHRYTVDQLRALERLYIGICYGISFIPALILAFIQTKDRGKAYGDADLWCWISLDWDPLRIGIFYGPVWVIIFATMAIYIYAGKHIYEKRKDMSFSSHSYPLQENKVFTNYMPSKDNEIQITTEMEVETTERMIGYPERPYSTSSITFEAHYPAMLSGTTISNTARASISGPAHRKRVPSTINRVYTMIDPVNSCYGLLLASAIVLPLQGFWNGVIYLFTSIAACRRLWQDIFGYRDEPVPHPQRSISFGRSNISRRPRNSPPESLFSTSGSTQTLATMHV
ncbi:MAG: hypothetical protein M1834_008041 [Cirrosporium novae-zelandiae]|nr:MAG: hypothetical protein M1834_008041 [Cirrosporium novae-zelandiae]